jgi:hypothetical protein
MGAQNVSPDTRWIARRLATAGGKGIKMWLLGTAVTVNTTPSARQQELYLYSVRRPTSSHSTRPVSAEPTRALPIGKNLCNAPFTFSPSRWQPNAEKLGSSQVGGLCTSRAPLALLKVWYQM